MSSLESETTIIINEADKRAGYFTFGTSYDSHFLKLCKRIGGVSNLLSVRESKSPEGKITWRQCKVPIKYLAKGLCIRTAKLLNRPRHLAGKFQKK